MHGFYSCFLQSVEKHPDNTAVELQLTSGQVQSYSYSELRRMSESVGRWLRESGMSEGVRCAIMSTNGPLWVTCYLGIMAAGASAVPLDTAFNAEQVNKLLWDSSAAVIFTDSEHLPVVEKAVDQTLVRIVMIDGSGEGRYSNLLGMLASGPGAFRPARLYESDVALIIYTSGTTSDPKGVMLTHKNLLAEAEAVFNAIPVSQTDTVLGVLPLFHVLAQAANLLLPFAKGARVVFLESLNTTELLRALGERGITLFCCVPQFFYLIHERVMREVGKRSWLGRTGFRLLMKIAYHSRRLGLNLGKLFFGRIHSLLGPKMRYLITGGSAFDVQIGADLRTLGFNVLQAYGLTETSGAATITPVHDNILGSIGKPLKGVEVKIVNAQAGENLNYPVGEIAISGEIVMKGYYNRTDATAEAIRDGWLYTGDLGYMDNRGNVFITGRSKEMIVLSSGKNVYPEEVEAHYLQSPFIREMCVMGLMNRPGEPLAERLHAVIVPDFEVLRERKIVNAREVIRFDVENLSEDLPNTKRILSFDIWPDPLPRTGTSKLKRFEIQRRVLANEPGQNSGRPATEEPSAEEALWLADPDAQKAMTIIRGMCKAKALVLASSNLELDLGFDSMERVELIVELERALSATAGNETVAGVYTVRELVDALLRTRGTAGGRSTGTAGWDAVLSAEPEDPRVLAVLDQQWFQTCFWFLTGRFVSLFTRIFYGLRVSGKEKLPRSGPFILSPNHQSFLDGPVVSSQIPWRLFRQMFFVGTSEIFGKGVLGYLGRSFKLVPVDPDSNLVNAMRAGAFGLKHGKILVLYPEGERSIDGVPKKFKKGAAILAAHLQVPIYPVAIEGFYEAWPRGKRFPRLGKLRIQFGDPVYPPKPLNNADETYEQLTEELRTKVVGMWEGLREEKKPAGAAVAGD
jgi:long-chain acyl-CoA synthetase